MLHVYVIFAIIPQMLRLTGTSEFFIYDMQT